MALPKTPGHSEKLWCGDDHAVALVQFREQVEGQRSSGLVKRQVAELVEDHQVYMHDLVGQATLLAGARLGLEPVHQVDGVEEAPAGAAPDERPGDGDREVGLAATGLSGKDEAATVGSYNFV